MDLYQCRFARFHLIAIEEGNQADNTSGAQVEMDGVTEFYRPWGIGQ